MNDCFVYYKLIETSDKPCLICPGVAEKTRRRLVEPISQSGSDQSKNGFTSMFERILGVRMTGLAYICRKCSDKFAKFEKTVSKIHISIE